MVATSHPNELETKRVSFSLSREETSPDKELVEDLTSIVHVFSCRLYGLRKYKKAIKEDKGGVLNCEVKCSSSAISQQDHENGS